MEESMKNLVVVWMLLLAPVSASSQNWLPAPLEVSVMGGFDMPTGALNDFYDSGYNLGGQFAFQFWPKIALGINGNRHAFTEPAEIDSLGFAGDVDVTIWEVTAFAKYRFVSGEGIAPYVRASLGAFINDVTARQGDTRIHLIEGTEFGVGVGGGIEGRLSRQWGIFLEGMYLLDFTEDEDVKIISMRGGLSLFLDRRPSTR
jgi:opacity protein-like surface antigen